MFLCLTFLSNFVWLKPLQLQPGDDIFPLDEDGKVISDGSNFLDTWEVIKVPLC